MKNIEKYYGRILAELTMNDSDLDCAIHSIRTGKNECNYGVCVCSYCRSDSLKWLNEEADPMTTTRFVCKTDFFVNDFGKGLHQKIYKRTVWELVTEDDDTVTLKSVDEDGFEIYISHRLLSIYFEEVANG